MRERFLDSDSTERPEVPLSQRPAGSCENDPFDLFAAAAPEGLVDRAVLGIDRDDLRAALARGGDDELPGDDERLLVRERESLARDDSGVRRPQSHRSDQTRDDDVGFRK